MSDKPTAERCSYCGTEHENRSTMETRRIIQRDNRAPRGIRQTDMWFCKGKPCSGYYQMGCEG